MLFNIAKGYKHLINTENNFKTVVDIVNSTCNYNNWSRDSQTVNKNKTGDYITRSYNTSQLVRLNELNFDYLTTDVLLNSFL